MPADFQHVRHMEGFVEPPVERVNLAPRPPGEEPTEEPSVEPSGEAVPEQQSSPDAAPAAGQGS